MEIDNLMIMDLPEHEPKDDDYYNGLLEYLDDNREE